jgi:exonuclease SbcD
MRLLHTSDWHLGRTVGQRPAQRSRDGDFDAVLTEIIGIACDARPDLIVHSGDLFDSWRPGAGDLTRCLRALRDLSEAAPVVVVAGNHDSPVLLEALDFAVTAFGTGSGPDGVPRLTFVARARHPRDGGILEYPARGGEQRVRLAALPFIHQNRFLDEFASPATATRDYARHLREIQAEMQRGLLDGCRPDQDVLIFAAHLYVQGALPSYTERPVEISDTYLTEADALPAVSYAALGHIHRPQAITLGGITARYAGSPLQLDFGEAGEEKSVVVVDADPGRPVRVELVPLRAGRRLADFTGTLEELRAQADRIGDAFVRAVIVSEQPIPHLAAAVKEAAPQATFVAIDPRCKASQAAVLDRTEADGDEPGLPDLFAEYLPGRVAAGTIADHVLVTFADLLADTEREDPGVFPEEAHLRSVLGEEPARRALPGDLLIPVQAAAGDFPAVIMGEQA